MKIFCTLFFAIASLISISIYSQEEMPTYQLSGLAPDELSSLIKEGSSFILECQPKDRVPVNYFLKGDLLPLKATPLDKSVLEIQKPIYVKFDASKVTFSTDKTKWKNLKHFVREKPLRNLKLIKAS